MEEKDVKFTWKDQRRFNAQDNKPFLCGLKNHQQSIIISARFWMTVVIWRRIRLKLFVNLDLLWLTQLLMITYIINMGNLWYLWMELSCLFIWWWKRCSMLGKWWSSLSILVQSAKRREIWALMQDLLMTYHYWMV